MISKYLLRRIPLNNTSGSQTFPPGCRWCYLLIRCNVTFENIDAIVAQALRDFLLGLAFGLAFGAQLAVFLRGIVRAKTMDAAGANAQILGYFELFDNAIASMRFGD